MFRSKECVAMLLAGGQGSRLNVLTREIAKPAVPFGGKYRIIDFTLSNCVNSGIDTVGVLTQYQPHELNAYIGNGRSWDLDRMHGGVSILPPYMKGKAGEWYKGTANAIYQNIAFIDRYHPKYVLVLSGDHIYKMNYWDMLEYHKKNEADCTIAVIEIPLSEAYRFGMMNTNPDGTIYEFEEKPKVAKSNKASMGIYIFNWDKLRNQLEADERNQDSANDFGRNIIPAMIQDGERVVAYNFEGYWKDVGTIESLWDANMDLINTNSGFDLNDPLWKIYSRNPVEPPHFVGAEANVAGSMLTEGSEVMGTTTSSIISCGVYVGHKAIVDHSVIMPGVHIDDGAVVRHAIIGENAWIGEGAVVGITEEETGDKHNITVIGGGVRIAPYAKVKTGTVVGADVAAV